MDQTALATRQPRTSPNSDAAAPFVPWPQLYGYLQKEFKQGDHVAILGPTDAGKSHIAFAVAEIRTYVMVVACKPRDRLIDDATKRGYYLVPGNKLEVPYSDGRPVHKRVIFWPRLPANAARKMEDRKSVV